MVDGTTLLRVRCTTPVYSHKSDCRRRPESRLSVSVSGLVPFGSEVQNGREPEIQNLNSRVCTSSLVGRDDTGQTERQGVFNSLLFTDKSKIRRFKT